MNDNNNNIVTGFRSQYEQNIEGEILSRNSSDEKVNSASMERLKRFKDEILTLSSKDFHLVKGVSQIKIISSTGFRFINPSIVQEILDGEGDLKIHSPINTYRAAFTHGFNFKQSPPYPLMEYAIYELFSKFTDNLSPPNELVRFEIDGGEKIYPVLISKEIKGITLNEGWQNFDLNNQAIWAKWSWLLLVSILIRPGDGRPSNYILDSDNFIHSTDNQISFVELIRNNQIQFACSLFCIFKEKGLDRDVLAAFCRLDSDAILSSWMDDVIKKNNEFSKLFSLKEQEGFFGDVNRSIIPILFAEGSIANLKMQFTCLQTEIAVKLKENQEITPITLLSFLVDLKSNQNRIKLIAQAYMKANQSNLEDRFKWAVSKSNEKSLPLSIADFCIFGKSLTFENIKLPRLLSSEKAKGELVMSLFQSTIAPLSQIQETTFRASFKNLYTDNLPDLKRQKLVLKSIIYLFTQKPNKPSLISIQYCQLLDTKSLTLFLHENLIDLDLSYCPKINSEDLVTIQRNCPNLKTLKLNGCTGLSAIHETGWRSKPLLFSELKELSIRQCSSLKTVRLIAPRLIHIERDQDTEIPIFEILAVSLFSEEPKLFPNKRIEIEITRDLIPLEKLISEKHIALEAIQKNPEEIKYISNELADDPDIILAAVSQKGELLSYASPRLRNNKEIVRVAMQEYVTAFAFASIELKEDEEFILEAVKMSGLALMYVTAKIKNNPKIILEAAKQTAFAFNLASSELKKNREFVLQVVSICGRCLSYASDDLKKDKDIVLAAIKNDPSAIQFVHSTTRMEIEGK